MVWFQNRRTKWRKKTAADAISLKHQKQQHINQGQNTFSECQSQTSAGGYSGLHSRITGGSDFEEEEEDEEGEEEEEDDEIEMDEEAEGKCIEAGEEMEDEQETRERLKPEVEESSGWRPEKSHEDVQVDREDEEAFMQLEQVRSGGNSRTRIDGLEVSRAQESGNQMLMCYEEARIQRLVDNMTALETLPCPGAANMSFCPPFSSSLQPCSAILPVSGIVGSSGNNGGSGLSTDPTDFCPGFARLLPGSGGSNLAPVTGAPGGATTPANAAAAAAAVAVASGFFPFNLGLLSPVQASFAGRLSGQTSGPGSTPCRIEETTGVCQSMPNLQHDIGTGLKDRVATLEGSSRDPIHPPPKSANSSRSISSTTTTPNISSCHSDS
ncbi:unnamed protein product, partial [Protopolystoma xenopodis]